MKIVKVYNNIVEFNTIIDCQIDRGINEHGHAIIKGWIDEGQDILKQISDITFANIYGVTDDGKILTLFSGIIENAAQKAALGAVECSISLIGTTKLMDMDVITKPYQNLTVTYLDIAEKLGKKYQAIINDQVGIRQTINGFIQQYRETDWEFLLRILSHRNTYVVPLCMENYIYINIGIDKQIQTLEADLIDYSMEKELCVQREHHEGTLQNVLNIKSRDFFELGDCIEGFNGKLMYIAQAASRYEGSELVHYYELKDFEDIRTEKQTNKKLIGASLDATVTDISKDKVKVIISADEKEDSAVTNWFPYSSVYSSPDGTGWYCMPEMGDRVRVYFPSEDETQAYVISAVHLDTTSQLRTNPDNKIIMNKYMKQIEFTPSTLKISNGIGMSILIDDEEGIKIESDKNIKLVAAQSFEMLSLTDKVEIAAESQVNLKQNNTSINLQDDIVVSGSQMYIQ